LNRSKLSPFQFSLSPCRFWLWLSGAEMNQPETNHELEAMRSILCKSEGFVEHQLRIAFKEAAQIYGFGGARQLTAEIINDYAQRGM